MLAAPDSLREAGVGVLHQEPLELPPATHRVRSEPAPQPPALPDRAGQRTTFTARLATALCRAFAAWPT